MAWIFIYKIKSVSQPQLRKLNEENQKHQKK